ncbi:hypothetical protein BIW11_04931 [Tropilaelaps mercedesae]|uniref:Uncharacterized protein n=1 Tax=Tropilaelaps mercedesae TaxID=418985 RepID=A0A1V9X041_9ACAR|nr:hypothetical protein BIW11_04931 [Tropilaelaps mercedesae]
MKLCLISRKIPIQIAKMMWESRLLTSRCLNGVPREPHQALCRLQNGDHLRSVSHPGQRHLSPSPLINPLFCPKCRQTMILREPRKTEHPRRNVLRKVASITLDRNFENPRTPPRTSRTPTDASGLHQQLGDKFEGHMLLNWLMVGCGDAHKAEVKGLLLKLCSRLLEAEIMACCEDDTGGSFKLNHMYEFQRQPLQQSAVLGRKLSTGSTSSLLPKISETGSPREGILDTEIQCELTGTVEGRIRSLERVSQSSQTEPDANIKFQLSKVILKLLPIWMRR